MKSRRDIVRTKINSILKFLQLDPKALVALEVEFSCMFASSNLSVDCNKGTRLTKVPLVCVFL